MNRRPALPLRWHVIPGDEYGPALLVARQNDHGTCIEAIIAWPDEWDTDFTVDAAGRRLDGYPLEVARLTHAATLAAAVEIVQTTVAPLWANDRYPVEPVA